MRAPRWLSRDGAPVAGAAAPEFRAALLVALIAVNAAFLPLLARTGGNSAGDRDAAVGLATLAAGHGPWWELHLTLGRVAPGAVYRLEGGSPEVRAHIDRRIVPPLLLTVGRAERWELGPVDAPLTVPASAPRELEPACRFRTCVVLLADGPPSTLVVAVRERGLVLIDERLLGAAG